MRAGDGHYPPKEFIPGLLQLRSHQLLSLTFVKENETAELMEVQREFKDGLKSFIQRRKLGTIVPIDFKEFITVSFEYYSTCWHTMCTVHTVCIQYGY